MWLKGTFIKDASSIIEKDRFWHSYQSFYGVVEEDRNYFLGLLWNALSMEGFCQSVFRVKRRRKLYGYRGLAFKKISTSALGPCNRCQPSEEMDEKKLFRRRRTRCCQEGGHLGSLQRGKRCPRRMQKSVFLLPWGVRLLC